jgi:hypothetical protein
MTKVQVEYELLRPLEDADLERISSAHGIYGFLRLQVGPDLKRIMIEYDASRLTPAEVESSLRKAAIPIGARL